MVDEHGGDGEWPTAPYGGYGGAAASPYDRGPWPAPGAPDGQVKGSPYADAPTQPGGYGRPGDRSGDRPGAYGTGYASWAYGPPPAGSAGPAPMTGPAGPAASAARRPPGPGGAPGTGGSADAAPRPPAGPGRRRRLLAAAAAAVAVAVVGVGAIVMLTSRDDATTAGGTPAPSPGGSAAGAPPPNAKWLSGASSDVAAEGREDRWRATPIAIGGTWDNGNAEQVEMRSICPGGPWADWDRPLDVAIGAIDVREGETWEAAAKGAYRARWTKNLQRIKQCWGSRDPGLLYIRFAHELNLGDSSWRVRGGEEASFVQAITLYSTLRYQILPKAKIVLCPNDGTQSHRLDDLDIRKLWPGKDPQGRPVVDVYAVDSYNMSPFANTVSEFNKKINASYDDGMPLGIEKHRQQAQKWGVPFAIGEWSNNGDPNNEGGGGESPLYVRQFYAWARSHAGDLENPQPGQLLYEVHFNLWDQYAFWPKTQQPRTAAAYKELPWGKV